MLNKIGSPFRVVDVLPGPDPIPGVTQDGKVVLAISNRDVWSGEQES